MVNGEWVKAKARLASSQGGRLKAEGNMTLTELAGTAEKGWGIFLRKAKETLKKCGRP